MGWWQRRCGGLLLLLLLHYEEVAGAYVNRDKIRSIAQHARANRLDSISVPLVVSTHVGVKVRRVVIAGIFHMNEQLGFALPRTPPQDQVAGDIIAGRRPGQQDSVGGDESGQIRRHSWRRRVGRRHGRVGWYRRVSRRYWSMGWWQRRCGGLLLLLLLHYEEVAGAYVNRDIIRSGAQHARANRLDSIGVPLVVSTHVGVKVRRVVIAGIFHMNEQLVRPSADAAARSGSQRHHRWAPSRTAGFRWQ